MRSGLELPAKWSQQTEVVVLLLDTAWDLTLESWSHITKTIMLYKFISAIKVSTLIFVIKVCYVDH